MTLPASGSRISFNDIRTEINVPSQAPFKIGEAERGTYSNINYNSNVVNSNPAKLSEWGSYSHITGSCAILSDRLLLGSWYDNELVFIGYFYARRFHNKWWFCQKTAAGICGSSEDSFLPRGSYLMTNAQSDGVGSFEISSFLGGIDLTELRDCFAWTTSSVGNLTSPSLEVFPVPNGYNYISTLGQEKFSNCGVLATIFSGSSSGSIDVSYSGSATGSVLYDINLGTNIGNTKFFYNSSDVPDQFIVTYDGVDVINTGYVGDSSYNTFLTNANFPTINGPASSSISFSKLSSTSVAYVRVNSPLTGSNWTFNLNNPSPPTYSILATPSVTDTFTNTQYAYNISVQNNSNSVTSGNITLSTVLPTGFLVQSISVGNNTSYNLVGQSLDITYNGVLQPSNTIPGITILGTPTTTGSYQNQVSVVGGGNNTAVSSSLTFVNVVQAPTRTISFYVRVNRVLQNGPVEKRPKINYSISGGGSGVITSSNDVDGITYVLAGDLVVNLGSNITYFLANNASIPITGCYTQGCLGNFTCSGNSQTITSDVSLYMTAEIDTNGNYSLCSFGYGPSIYYTLRG
jgi:hypothetical protein